MKLKPVELTLLIGCLVLVVASIVIVFVPDFFLFAV